MSAVYAVGTKVIVHDRMRGRNYRAVVVESIAGKGTIRRPGVPDQMYFVRFVDEHGQVVTTHRWADELTAAAQVLGDRARLVWQAMRMGATKQGDSTDDDGIRVRWYGGPGIHLLIRGGAQ